jgi:hypothetical protein
MAEETKIQSQEGQAPAPAKEEPKEDFENKYKEMQGKYDQLHQELKTAKETLDAVTPYVNWEAAQGKPAEDDSYVSKKDIEERIRSVSEMQENRILELQFRVDHPELKGYETTLVAPALVRARREHPRVSKEKLLEIAAKDVTDFLETERKKGEQKAKETKAKADAEAMSGLESGGATTPKPEDEGQTNDEYVAYRRKILNKKKGL